MYAIGTAKFESLIELVSYYEKHPLYKKVKLWFPISEDIVRQIIAVSIPLVIPPREGAGPCSGRSEKVLHCSVRSTESRGI